MLANEESNLDSGWTCIGCATLVTNAIVRLTVGEDGGVDGFERRSMSLRNIRKDYLSDSEVADCNTSTCDDYEPGGMVVGSPILSTSSRRGILTSRSAQIG